MQTHPAQNIQGVTTQLTALIEQIKAGVAGDALVAEVQAVLANLEAVATTDSLTGALNRRGLVEKLDAELDRAKRTGHPFSFAVISIDQYHSLQEQFGSVISDQVLRNLTGAVLKLIRTLDSFGRISANEFALLLPITWLDQSDGAIVRLTGAVSALDWASIAPSLAVTFSTGMTTNMPGDDADKMILRASQALMLAKAKGPGSSAQLDHGLLDIDPGVDLGF